MAKTINVTAADNGNFSYSGDADSSGKIEIDQGDTINFVLGPGYTWYSGTASGAGNSAFWVTPNPGSPKVFTWSIDAQDSTKLVVNDSDADGTTDGASHDYDLYVVNAAGTKIKSDPQIINRKTGGN